MFRNARVPTRLIILLVTAATISIYFKDHLATQLSSIRNSIHSFFIPEYVKDKSEVTIVTAYFLLPKAKHSAQHYMTWLQNLLSFCQSPMIIFTTAELYPQLYRLRRNGSLPSHFIVDYSSPMQMPPIRPLVSTFEKQHPSDPERAYHSVELYAVWCAKSFMLNRSAQLNPFRTRYFLYADAGAFRTRQYRFELWPNPSVLNPILSNDRFLLGMIAPLPRRLCPTKYQLSEGPLKMNLIEGTFMAGSAKAVHWWTDMYYKTIEDYRRRNFFIGKDQSVMNVIALVHAHRLNMLLPFRTLCGDVWFAFGPLFADPQQRRNLSFSDSCQKQNLSKLVIPYETVCEDQLNVV